MKEKSNIEWFKDSKWGVFCHYLSDSPSSTSREKLTAEEWNKRINNFDTYGLAGQLEEVGAKYFFITIGQNSGYYCAPNETYDSIVGIKPSKCSKRDLIGDIYNVLSPRKIKLMVYLPSGAPSKDKLAIEKLEWEWGFEGGWPSWDEKKHTGKRLANFQNKWEAVIKEWSNRWGRKVCGWWIDGCYFSDEMYKFTEAPNFESFANALKSGNPDSIVAFNPGVKLPVISLSEYEDYTAGEISDAFPVCPGRMVNGAQYHILSYLGTSWGRGTPRFSDEFVIGYTKDVYEKGGVISWDVPIMNNGLIPQPFVKQLSELNKGLNR